MLKRYTRKLLGTLGLQITRTPRKRTIHHAVLEKLGQSDRGGYVKALAKDPLNADLHMRFAVEASKTGKLHLAYAELKTAQYLGGDGETLDELLSEFRQALPDPASMNHNQYFRFMSLSSEILKRGCDSDLSILDVGGGHGQLASFLPANIHYCLVEPAVNGISGTNLPFPDHSFDYAVSCHVLEHIPVNDRFLFLDQLLSKSRRGAILLNPFHVEGTHIEDRLRLVIDITGAQWAKEHLDCSLPKIEDVRSYAEEKGLHCCVIPNGTLATSLAFAFIDHFAAKSGLWADWKKVNAFYNEKYMTIMTSAEYPNAFLIYLGWPKSSTNVAEPNAAAEG
jgi:SAM-dependent methyltransferase